MNRSKNSAGRLTSGSASLGVKDMLRTQSLDRLGEMYAQISSRPLEPGENPVSKANFLELLDEVYQEGFERQNMPAAAREARAVVKRLQRGKISSVGVARELRERLAGGDSWPGWSRFAPKAQGGRHD